jgi:predicted GTPase
MSRWRIAVVLALLVGPLAFLACFGGFVLWERGWGFRLWWPLMTSMAVGYYLGWYWLRHRQLLELPDSTPPVHWADRDQAAWKLVETRAQTVAQLPRNELAEIPFYVNIAQEMALELARFYHPDAGDPYSSLTVPEILTVVELASHDLAELVDRNVPGGHVLTIHDWRWAREATNRATEWYRTANTLYWLGAAILSPVDTGLRFAASQLGVSRPWQMFQQDLIAWFHTAFVHRLGRYLIDLNSGRLRVGAERYRQLTCEPDVEAQVPLETAREVTLTILGQVKMGKSSFINALLGEQRARTDVLPATNTVTRYELKLPEVPTRLVLLDTVGYAHTGPKEDQLKATREAAQHSDLLVLVLHARNPARQADVEMLQALRAWFAEHPELKMPAVLAVMTHIDLLSPTLEWAPPYNWQEPTRVKEQQIQAALTALREQLGDFLIGAVPVCTAEGKTYGIEEWFLPTLAELLGEAKAVGLLRCLRAEADARKVRKVFEQLLAVGGQLLDVWLRGKQKKQTMRLVRDPASGGR